MARLARVVVPGVPHHVTQRGNRRQQTFFGDDDYRLYLQQMAESCARHEAAVWAYCLMPNHVHLIVVPREADSLARAIGEAHRRYTRAINRRQGWTGFLWQGRFASVPLDGAHLLAAARYVELNPLGAGLAERPEDWPWSSARAHLRGRDDGLVEVAPLRGMIGGSWRSFLAGGVEAGEIELIERHLGTGRPLGDAGFVADLERRLGRALAKRKPGRKPKPAGDAKGRAPRRPK